MVMNKSNLKYCKFWKNSWSCCIDVHTVVTWIAQCENIEINNNNTLAMLIKTLLQLHKSLGQYLLKYMEL